MTSRFSALHRRFDIGETATPPPSPKEQGVVIPNSRRPAPKAETAPQKANRVLDARDRIHRMLIEEINLVALERLPRDEMRRQIHDFVSEKTRE